MGWPHLFPLSLSSPPSPFPSVLLVCCHSSTPPPTPFSYQIYCHVIFLHGTRIYNILHWHMLIKLLATQLTFSTSLALSLTFLDTRLPFPLFLHYPFLSSLPISFGRSSPCVATPPPPPSPPFSFTPLVSHGSLEVIKTSSLLSRPSLNHLCSTSPTSLSLL